jgi:ketosteroid isomerase-like protein
MTNTHGLRTEPQESARTAPSKMRRWPWWAGALALVPAVAVGVGIGFLTSGRASATSPAADPQVEQFVDDFFAGWNAYDADAIRAMATADAVLNTRDLTATGATSLEARVEDYRADGVSFEQVGAPIVSDVGDAIDVVQLFEGGISEGNTDKYILVLRLIKDDDTLKVEWDRAYNYQTWRSSLGL